MSLKTALSPDETTGPELPIEIILREYMVKEGREIGFLGSGE